MCQAHVIMHSTQFDAIMLSWICVAAAQDMETQDALRDSSNFSNGEASSAVQTEAAAQQAYVQSLVKR